MGWLKKIALGIIGFFVLLIVIGAILGPPEQNTKQPVTPTTTVKKTVNLGITNFKPGTYIFLWVNGAERILLGINGDCLYQWIGMDGDSKQFWTDYKVIDKNTIELNTNPTYILKYNKSSGNYELIVEGKRNIADYTPDNSFADVEVYIFGQNDPGYKDILTFSGELDIYTTRGNLKTQKISGFTPKRFGIVDSVSSIDVYIENDNSQGTIYVVVFDPATGKVLNHDSTRDTLYLTAYT